MNWVATANACSPRPIRNSGQLLVSASMSAPEMNSTGQVTNRRFLPQMSLILPSSGVAAAPTRPIRMTTQLMLPPTSRSVPVIFCSAVAIIVYCIGTTSVASTTTSTRRREAWSRRPVSGTVAISSGDGAVGIVDSTGSMRGRGIGLGGGIGRCDRWSLATDLERPSRSSESEVAASVVAALPAPGWFSAEREKPGCDAPPGL